MTEWQRLQAGLVYNDFDEELFARRVAAKKLFRQYNATADDEGQARREILGALFKRLGQRVWIEPDFRCEFGANISVEDDVYINFGCIILDCAEVTIGAGSLLGPNIGIYAVKHSLDAAERTAGGCQGAPVHIGRRVWLGGDVKILHGVTIGRDSVVGAGSVVTRDVPPGTLAAGNPCRPLREIGPEDRMGYPAG